MYNFSRLLILGLLTSNHQTVFLHQELSSENLWAHLDWDHIYLQNVVKFDLENAQKA
jgi:hypothetical protein